MRKFLNYETGSTYFLVDGKVWRLVDDGTCQGSIAIRPPDLAHYPFLAVKHEKQEEQMFKAITNVHNKGEKNESEMCEQYRGDVLWHHC